MKNGSRLSREDLLDLGSHEIYVHLERILQSLCQPKLAGKLDHVADDFEGIFHNPQLSPDEMVADFSIMLSDLADN